MMNDLTIGYIKSILKHRDAVSNKSNHGHALLVVGRKGFMGAAVIASKACLRSGVGLITVCVPDQERFVLQIAVPEVMVLSREENHYLLERISAIGIGPGMGIDERAEEIVLYLLSRAKFPLVLDADALTIISRNKELLSSLPSETILTPHSGEFDRLFGSHTSNEERIITATRVVQEFNLIVVLKGPKTAIITPQQVFHNTTGNAGLAKGGSGDALTGVITSFLAQGYQPLIATQLGVYLHGLAADLTLNEQSM